jgi:hypothetical protein
MTFDFTIRKNIRASWDIFAHHWIFFVSMSLVTVLLNVFSDRIERWHSPYTMIAIILGIFVSIVWAFVWVKVSLYAIQGKEEKLSIGALKEMLPTGRQFLQLTGVAILVGCIVLFGFVLFIIPGIYCMVRLAFANVIFIDKDLAIQDAVKYSWHMVSGDSFWTVLLVLLICVTGVILGTVLFGVGIIITYPVVMLLIARLYRALDDFYVAKLASKEPIV